MQGFWGCKVVPAHRRRAARSPKTAGDQDHRADPKVTRIMSPPLWSSRGSTRRQLVARMRGRLLGDLRCWPRSSAAPWASRPSLWFEQGLTISASASRTCQAMSLLGISTPMHGLYCLLMHGWFAVFPPTELWLRRLPAAGDGAAAAGVWFAKQFRDAPRRCVREPMFDSAQGDVGPESSTLLRAVGSSRRLADRRTREAAVRCNTQRRWLLYSQF